LASYKQKSKVVVDFIPAFINFSAIYPRLQQWKGDWNWSTSARVIAKIKLVHFSLMLW